MRFLFTRRWILFAITVAALAVAVASISAELGHIAVSEETFGFEWIGWTAYAELLGLLVVALGFLSARISVPLRRGFGGGEPPSSSALTGAG